MNEEISPMTPNGKSKYDNSERVSHVSEHSQSFRNSTYKSKVNRSNSFGNKSDHQSDEGNDKFEADLGPLE